MASEILSDRPELKANMYLLGGPEAADQGSALLELILESELEQGLKCHIEVGNPQRLDKDDAAIVSVNSHHDHLELDALAPLIGGLLSEKIVLVEVTDGFKGKENWLAYDDDPNLKPIHMIMGFPGFGCLARMLMIRLRRRVTVTSWNGTRNRKFII